MSASYFSRHGAKAIAALAASLALWSAIRTDSSSPRQQPQEPQARGPRVEAPRYVGDAPALLPESTTIVLQTTPEELVASVIAARARGDLAALARCCSTSAGRPSLDQLDAVRAERDFVEGAALWTRLEAAAARKTLRIEQERRRQQGAGPDATGFLTFASGAASSEELQIPIARIGGAWFVWVAP